MWPEFAGATLRIKTSIQGQLRGVLPQEQWLNFGMLLVWNNAEGIQGL